MDDEQWEALDLDDFEFSSPLQPCKRRSHLQPSQNNPKKSFNTTSLLEPCSHLSSQTLTPLSSIPPPSLPSYHHLIPGPARVVQEAMLRKLNNNANSFGVDGDPIPTQEYIRRAVEDPGDDDNDFNRNPWLFAVDYIRSQGLVGSDGVSIGTPLSLIKSDLKMDHADQVVAIVKSCTPNGLGDLMVSLKDPTGTIDANIHHRVLTDSENGRDICVGSVLVLHKVAVFAPSHFARYLNITVSSMVKVIQMDPLQQKVSASTERNFTPVTENSNYSPMQDNSVDPPSHGRSEAITNHLRENATQHSSKQMEGDSTFLSNCSSGEKRNQIDIIGLLVRQDDVVCEMQTVGTGNIDQGNPEVMVNGKAKNNQSDNVVEAIGVSELVEAGEEEIVSRDEILKQKQAQILGGSLPEWTDEQLGELFDFD